jgi:pilus assembly protein FimV
MLLGLLASLQVHAFSLGRVQGAALIGRPLEVTIQVQLDPGQTITSACFAADVFHGDARQNPAGVNVQFEPATSALGARLRVTSGSRIDEPIVTVYVRAGCADIVSRRYVLLADIVSEQAFAPTPRVAAVPLVDPTRAVVPAAMANSGRASQLQASPDGAGPSASGNGAAAAASQRPPRDAPAARRAKRSVEKRPAAASAVSRPAAPVSKAIAPRASATATAATPSTEPVGGKGQSRLRLDPLDMLSERVATLESNTTAAPAQLSEREVRDAERLERLEASVKALLVLAEKNEASLRDVRSRLALAQETHFTSTVVYALFGLLLLCLLAIAYLLTRVNRRPEVVNSRWFDAEPEPAHQNVSAPAVAAMSDAPEHAASAASAAPATPSQPASPHSSDRKPTEPARPMPHDAGVRTGAAARAPVDASLVEMSESTFDRLMQSSGAHSAIRHSRQTAPVTEAKVAENAATVALAQRPSINSEALIDIRQRAEFFVSLGQTDQAVQVLEARIAQDAASCPQAHLDLLKLFHSLGLKADYMQVGDEFVKIFNTRLPEFAQFDDEGRSLEDYPGEVDRLIAAWKKSTVLETIEQMVFRSPASGDAAAFDLAAFRDLLMLHAVAETVRYSAVGGTGATGARAPLPLMAAASHVDIDLSESFAPDAAATVPLTQIDADDSASRTPQAATGDAPQDNLIDFDIEDSGLGDKAGKHP